MIFVIISLILLAALIYLTVAGSLGGKRLKQFCLINTIIGVAGAVLTLGAYLVAVATINNASVDAEWSAWASDMFVGFFNLALPVFLVLFSVIALSSITAMASKRLLKGFMAKLRVITPIAVSALLLIITYFYAPATANETVPLNLYVYIAGIGLALAMRLTYAVEYTVHFSSAKAKK